MWGDILSPIEKKGHCKKHGEFTVQVLRLYESVPPMCPTCSRELSDATEAQERVELLHKRWRNSNVEPTFWGRSIADFNAVNPALKIARDKVSELIATEQGEIVLLGGNGVGKTMLGSLAVMELGGYIYSMYEISTRIRQSYSARAKESELEIVRELAECPMLVIDEIGRTKNSEAEQNWLSYIIDKRHIRCLPFILISNNSEIEKILGNDILSRLQERASIIEIDAEDYRGNL